MVIIFIKIEAVTGGFKVKENIDQERKPRKDSFTTSICVANNGCIYEKK